MNEKLNRERDAVTGLLVRLAGREHAPAVYLAALSVAAVVVVLVLPLLAVVAGRYVDASFGVPAVESWVYRRPAALFLTGFGIYVTVRCVWLMYAVGGGTPNPLLPTKRLVTSGPFEYCRNPLSPSVAVYVSGVALWFGTLSGAALVLGLLAVLLVFVRLFEEKELEARFGEEYRAYRARTPFLFPSLRKKRG